MTQRAIILLIITSAAGLLSSSNKPVWTSQRNVYDVLWAAGVEKPGHWIDFNEKMVKRGEEIVKTGRTTGPGGLKSQYVSQYYTCLACHNIEQEDPDLRESNPDTRLPYVKEKDIPFLQGTTFKGIVNRESWYNDDYLKKYGEEMVQKAHNSLRESIQLCAEQCSQGRKMKPWELDAVLAYFWSLQYNLEDLGFTEKDYEKLAMLEKNPKETKEELVQWIRSFYSQKSPAHFFDAPDDLDKGYSMKGNADTGETIYDQSCMHCHSSNNVTRFIIDEEKTNFNFLKNNMVNKDSGFSLYHIIPYGTYATPEHKPYMPLYPLERMSKQQVEDLRAYIEKMAQ
ncbi:MAG: cytochrome c [Saprospiraceae bacterium]|nr:cytochrome c [Saprospiraceae bacterium]MCB9325827.1 cytochrome c [Lewinellaceae bacterium]